MANREDVVIMKNQFSLSLHSSLDAAVYRNMKGIVQKPHRHSLNLQYECVSIGMTSTFLFVTVTMLQ